MIRQLKTFLHKLVTNPLNTCTDLGPLRDYACPRCQREWKDQWGGQDPDNEIVLYMCPVCCQEFGIGSESMDTATRRTPANYVMARDRGFMLKIKRTETPNFFASLEQRFSR